MGRVVESDCLLQNNKPKEAISKQHMRNNLVCKISYFCTSLTFKHADSDSSEWRSFIMDQKVAKLRH